MEPKKCQNPPTAVTAMRNAYLFWHAEFREKKTSQVEEVDIDIRRNDTNTAACGSIWVATLLLQWQLLLSSDGRKKHVAALLLVGWYLMGALFNVILKQKYKLNWNIFSSQFNRMKNRNIGVFCKESENILNSFRNFSYSVTSLKTIQYLLFTFNMARKKLTCNPKEVQIGIL